MRGGLWIARASACLIVLLALGLVVWLITPWPTEAARYAWRRWQAPTLALTLDRSDAPLAMQIGNYYFGATILGRTIPAYDPALAESAFSKALAIEPGILWGHYSLARIAFAKSDFKTALAQINAELAAHPENLRALYIRGLIYGYRALPGDLALAEDDFANFAAWAPTEWAGYNDLAWILMKEGKYADAETAMATAFSRVPGAAENPWLWNALGSARLALGDYPSAAAAFERAKRSAAALTTADWYRAYSGDDPGDDAAGLASFRAGIDANLARASSGAP